MKLLNWGFKIYFIVAILLFFALDVKLWRNYIYKKTISVKQEQISESSITLFYLQLRKTKYAEDIISIALPYNNCTDQKASPP